ncbi:MAG: hypothetical protein QM484_11565 [Woeseiaceae bacterium]
MSRVEGMPVYAQRDEMLPAKLYNLWRRLKLHFDLPVRIPLEGYRSLVMVLETHEWVCVDETQNDMPVLAWIEFEDQGRKNIHLPVKCKLNHYHFAADKVRAASLELMEAALEKKLFNKK